MEKTLNKLTLTNKALQKEVEDLQSRVKALEDIINKIHGNFGPFSPNDCYISNGNPAKMVFGSKE